MDSMSSFKDFVLTHKFHCSVFCLNCYYWCRLLTVRFNTTLTIYTMKATILQFYSDKWEESLITAQSSTSIQYNQFLLQFYMFVLFHVHKARRKINNSPQFISFREAPPCGARHQCKPSARCQWVVPFIVLLFHPLFPHSQRPNCYMYMF
jgi:hypothetical protein